MSYTIKNLREVEDIAPRMGFDHIEALRFARQDLEAKHTGLALHTFRPGQRGRAHRHERAEEVYLVLSGSGRVKLDDDVRDIGPMDAVRVAPGVARAFACDDDEPLELLAFGAHHEADGELIDVDFWA